MVPTLLVYVYYICLDRCNLSLVEAGVFGGARTAPRAYFMLSVRRLALPWPLLFVQETTKSNQTDIHQVHYLSFDISSIGTFSSSPCY